MMTTTDNTTCQPAHQSAGSIVKKHEDNKAEVKTIIDIIDSLERKEYDDDLTKEISRDIVASLRKTLASFNVDKSEKPFIIACCGQVKAGKSYFLSEILRGIIVLPSEDLPCTRRCIRISYNDKKVYRLNKITDNKDGTFTEEVQTDYKEFNKVKDIRTHIVLTDEEIKEIDNFMVLVEIGVPSELLRSGIEFVDTPGLNEPLQNLSLSVNSILAYLQPNILLYIFDYRETFSLKDCTRLDAVCKSLRGNNYKLMLIANKVDTDTEAAQRDGNQAVLDKPYAYNVDEVINDRMKKWFPRITTQQAFPLSTLRLRDHRLDAESGDYGNDDDNDKEEMKAFLEFQTNLERGLIDHMHMLNHDLIESCVFDWRILYLFMEWSEKEEHKKEIERADTEAEKWEKYYPFQSFLSDIKEIMLKLSDMKRSQFEGNKVKLQDYFDEDVTKLSDDEQVKLIKKIVEINIITDFIEARCFEILAYSFTHIRQKAFREQMECRIDLNKCSSVVNSLAEVKNIINTYFKEVENEFIKQKSSLENATKHFAEINCEDYVDKIKDKYPIKFLAKKLFQETGKDNDYVDKVKEAKSNTEKKDDLIKLKEDMRQAKEEIEKIMQKEEKCEVKSKLQLNSLNG